MGRYSLYGKPISPSDFSRHFGRLLEQAGLPSIRLHDARHTYATLLLKLGEGPKVVQSLLSHSSVSIILDIYSHISLGSKEKPPPGWMRYLQVRNNLGCCTVDVKSVVAVESG